MTAPTTGTDAERVHTVTDDDTAAAVGSGALPVLGTPRLLAWLEEVTCAVLDPTLDAGTTSVGTRMEVQHTRASPVGALVTVTASLSHADGRLRRFSAAARHADPAAPEAPGPTVATAEITRLVVDVDRFMSRL